MKKYYYLSIAVLSVIFITGISLVFAQSWVPPAGPPTGNNAVPSINVSDLTQTKAGNLWAAHLSAESDVYANQSILAPGTIESTDNTKILTIDSNAGGQFEWREAGPWAAGGGNEIGGYEIVIGNQGNSDTPSIAYCSPGKKILGGGCSLEGWDPHYGYGFPEESETSYSCTTSFGNTLRAYAICVSGI
jgi:hypothetical protein